jgi:dUTPase
VPPSHFGLLLPLIQQSEIEVAVLTGVIGLGYQGEIGLIFYNGGKAEHVWNTEYLLLYILVS